MKFSYRKTAVLSLSLIMLVSTASAVMAEDKPEADLTIGAYSQYIWRGWELSQDSVVLQPSMTVSYKGFAFNIWGNMDTNYYATDTGNWNETDVTISYDGSAGKVGYGVGLIYYGLEDGAEDSQEVYASVSLDTLLAPTLTVYNDISNYQGWYATLGIGHSIPVAEGVSLDLGAQIGYLDDEDTYNEFHDGLLSVSMSIPVGEYISVTPELYYSFALTSDSETVIKGASVDGDDDSFLYGGISTSFAF